MRSIAARVLSAVLRGSASSISTADTASIYSAVTSTAKRTESVRFSFKYLNE